MRYRGSVLVIDNFRSILSDFSRDLQDVVRSAILDGVDISEYIDKCKNNPYRLEQIRLGKIEGLNPIFFSYQAGDIIKGIRNLRQMGINLSPVEKYREADMDIRSLYYLIEWCKAGYDISNLDLRVLPVNLLGYFDEGLEMGLDMSIFNNGVQFSNRYLKGCMQIHREGLDVQKFLMGDYPEEVIDYLASMVYDRRRYKAIYKVAEYDDRKERLEMYEKIFSLGKDLEPYAVRGENFEHLISDDALRELVSGLECGVELVGSLESYDLDYIEERVAEEKLNGRKITSGKLRRYT